MARTPLRAVDQSEDPPAGTPGLGGGGNGGSSHGERLARIEAKMEHVATREDVSEVKVLIEQVKVLIEHKESTMMRWLLGILATAGISVAVVLVRTFFSS